MKKFIIALIFNCSILLSSNANAIHGNPYYSGTIDFCQNELCDLYTGLESGTDISAAFTFAQLDPFPDLGNIFDYSITLTGASDSITLDVSNTFIVENTATAYVDEFEVTTLSGGIFSIDTTYAFDGALGLPSTLRFDFNLDRVDFYVTDALAASTSPVPVPGALILLFSGLIPLLSFAKRKQKI